MHHKVVVSQKSNQFCSHNQFKFKLKKKQLKETNISSDLIHLLAKKNKISLENPAEVRGLYVLIKNQRIKKLI